MDDDTCIKNLKTLMMKNYKLLEIRSDIIPGKQTPGGSGIIIRDDTIIGINEAFTSQLNRIQFPAPVLEEVYKKGKCLSSYIRIEIILEDRSIAIEAAIVRIMKSRKKLDHTNLV